MRLPLDNEKFALLLLQTAASVTHQINGALRPRNLRISTYKLVRELYFGPARGIPVVKLSSLLSLKPDITRMLRRLVKAGIVERSIGEEKPKNTVFIRLTPYGESLYEESQHELGGIYSRIMEPLDIHSIELLSGDLEAINEEATK